MAMTHEDAEVKFANDMAGLMDRTPAYYGLPREAFSIVCADSDLRADINERVRQELDEIEDGYNEIVMSDREDMHLRDMGKISFEEYEERDRQREGLAGEVSHREREAMGIVFGEIERRFPGTLEEDILERMAPELAASDERMSEQMADTESRLRSSIYTSDLYFNLADGAVRLSDATQRVEECRDVYETAAPEDLDDAYYALSDAQNDQHGFAHDMAFSWYAVESYEQHVAGEEVTPFSFEVIGDKEQEIVDMMEHDGFEGVMSHIDEHVFYEMNLPEQLEVVSQRFERNEAINAGLVDYCVNKSMTKFAQTQEVVANEYDDEKSHELFRADIEAAKQFKVKYPMSNIISDATIGAMEMAYTTDGRSVGLPSSQREGVDHTLVSSDGFAMDDYSDDFDNPDA